MYILSVHQMTFQGLLLKLSGNIVRLRISFPRVHAFVLRTTKGNIFEKLTLCIGA